MCGMWHSKRNYLKTGWYFGKSSYTSNTEARWRMYESMNCVTIGSWNCLSPDQRQAFTRTMTSNITVTSWWVRWRLKSPVSPSFTQPLFGRTSKKTSKLRVAGLCAGNSPMNGEFPAQMASNAEFFSAWWRHHENKLRWNMDPSTTRSSRFPSQRTNDSGSVSSWHHHACEPLSMRNANASLLTFSLSSLLYIFILRMTWIRPLRGRCFIVFRPFVLYGLPDWNSH